MAQSPPVESSYVDIFQHILDEYERESAAIRNTTIDEAVKVAEGGYFYTAVATADHIAAEIEKLKG